MYSIIIQIFGEYICFFQLLSIDTEYIWQGHNNFNFTNFVSVINCFFLSRSYSWQLKDKKCRKLFLLLFVQLSLVRDQKGLLPFSLVFLCVPEPLRQLDSRLGPKQQEDLAIQPVVQKGKRILVGYIYTALTFVACSENFTFNGQFVLLPAITHIIT